MCLYFYSSSILKCKIIPLGSHIKAYHRVPPAAFLHRIFPFGTRPALNLASPRGDVGRFVVKDGVVVAGDTWVFPWTFNLGNTCFKIVYLLYRSGSLFVWRASTGRLQFKKINCHSSEISAVKLNKNIIVSGGRDKFVKVISILVLLPLWWKFILHCRLIIRYGAIAGGTFSPLKRSI